MADLTSLVERHNPTDLFELPHAACHGRVTQSFSSPVTIVTCMAADAICVSMTCLPSTVTCLLVDDNNAGI